MFERITRLQEAIHRVGLGASLLRLPAPRLLALPGPERADNEAHEEFTLVIDHDEIIEVCRDLFVSGFYQESVESAFKHLDEKVQLACSDELKARGKDDLSGNKLMELVFSPSEPIIPINRLSNRSEKDEQQGYHRLFSGSVLGIRNPCAHSLKWIDDPKHALEVLVLCQHLLKKLDLAISLKTPT